MSNNRECAEYFQRQRGYDRAFLEMRKKWESYGRASGRIVLSGATEEEKRALSGILGKRFYDDEIRFTMREFEEALKKTRFSSVALHDLLEQYFGQTICTNQQRAAERKAERERFFDNLMAHFQQNGTNHQVADWIQNMRKSRKHGYSLLISEWKKDPDSATAVVQNTAAALERLICHEEEVPLAVFAAKCTKNPHYFDRGTTAGALLLHGIGFLEKSEFPQNAYAWRMLLQKAGIVPDNISNMVTEYGIHLQTGTGLHPAYEAFYQMKQPGVITMENLKGIEGAYSDHGCVCIVENEMVFSFLLEQTREKPAAFLCTSGQLRAAALELIDFLVQRGATIYYSGDMDPDGMLIADKLWKKYPENVILWRMSVGDYMDSLSEEEVNQQQLCKLSVLENPQLLEIAARMREIKKASYQENLKELLVGDVLDSDFLPTIRIKSNMGGNP